MTRQVLRSKMFSALLHFRAEVSGRSTRCQHCLSSTRRHMPLLHLSPKASTEFTFAVPHMKTRLNLADDAYSLRCEVGYSNRLFHRIGNTPFIESYCQAAGGNTSQLLRGQCYDAESKYRCIIVAP